MNMISPYKTTNSRKIVTDCQHTSKYVTDNHKTSKKQKGGSEREDNFFTVARNVVGSI